MIKITRRLTLGVLLSLPATQILAQPAWPERPVRLIVPFPPRRIERHCCAVFGREFARQAGPAISG